MISYRFVSSPLPDLVRIFCVRGMMQYTIFLPIVNTDGYMNLPSGNAIRVAESPLGIDPV